MIDLLAGGDGNGLDHDRCSVHRRGVPLALKVSARRPLDHNALAAERDAVDADALVDLCAVSHALELTVAASHEQEEGQDGDERFVHFFSLSERW